MSPAPPRLVRSPGCKYRQRLPPCAHVCGTRLPASHAAETRTKHAILHTQASRFLQRWALAVTALTPRSCWPGWSAAAVTASASCSRTRVRRSAAHAAAAAANSGGCSGAAAAAARQLQQRSSCGGFNGLLAGAQNRRSTPVTSQSLQSHASRNVIQSYHHLSTQIASWAAPLTTSLGCWTWWTACCR